MYIFSSYHFSHLIPFLSLSLSLSPPFSLSLIPYLPLSLSLSRTLSLSIYMHMYILLSYPRSYNQHSSLTLLSFLTLKLISLYLSCPSPSMCISLVFSPLKSYIAIRLFLLFYPLSRSLSLSLSLSLSFVSPPPICHIVSQSFHLSIRQYLEIS